MLAVDNNATQFSSTPTQSERFNKVPGKFKSSTQAADAYQGALSKLACNVYILGGFIENAESVIERFNLRDEKWEVVNKLLNNRTKFATIPLPEQRILLMGGKRV